MARDLTVRSWQEFSRTHSEDRVLQQGAARIGEPPPRLKFGGLREEANPPGQRCEN